MKNNRRLRLELVLFHFILNSPPVIRDLKSTRLYSDKKNEKEISDEQPHINESILKLMTTVGNRIISKKPWNFNFMLEYYITILIQQFTKTLNQFLILSRKYFLWMML